jgi:hypothetical protein
LIPEKEVGTTKTPQGSKEEGLGESCDRARECGLICPRSLSLSTISTVSLSPISDFGFNYPGPPLNQVIRKTLKTGCPEAFGVNRDPVARTGFWHQSENRN